MEAQKAGKQHTHNLDATRGGQSTPGLGHFSPCGNKGCPLYWKLLGSRARYGRVEQILLQPALEPRHVHPVASIYTD